MKMLSQGAFSDSKMAGIGIQMFFMGAIGMFALQGTALFLRDAGHPSQLVSMVYFASIPWVLRFLLAPFVDRHSSQRHGHFRFWILSCQTLACVFSLIFLIADPVRSPYLIIGICIFLTLAVGLQNLAMFGFMAARLTERERIPAMTMQTVAFGLSGLVMGGGILYLLADLGWFYTVLAVFILAVATLLVTAFQRFDKGMSAPNPTATFRNQFAILGRREPLRLLLLTITVEVAMSAVMGLQSIMLIDTGFSVAQSSLVAFVGISATSIVGAILFRPLVARLDGYKSLLLIGISLGALTAAFGAFFQSGMSGTAAVTLILGGNLIMMGVMIASRAVLLGLCEPGREATDMAVFTGVEGFLFLTVTGSMTAAADLVGVPNLLLIAGLFTLVATGIVYKVTSSLSKPRLLAGTST